MKSQDIQKDCELTWKHKATTIRNLEDEDGYVDVLIRQWDVRNNGKVLVEYTVPKIDVSLSDTLDATISSGDKSEFEEFIESIDGYSIENVDSIEDEIPTAKADISLKEDTIESSLVTDAKNQSAQNGFEWYEGESKIGIMMLCCFSFAPMMLICLILTLGIGPKNMEMTRQEFIVGLVTSNFLLFVFWIPIFGF